MPLSCPFHGPTPVLWGGDQLPDLAPPPKEAPDEGSCWAGLGTLPFIRLPPTLPASHRVAEGIGFLQAKISI